MLWCGWTGGAGEVTGVGELLAALEVYGAARRRLLGVLGHSSNRDPLAEVAEHLVARLTGGTLAVNRVQKDWDVELPDGRKAQVKYLANGAGGVWVNEHRVRRIEGVDWYVVVVIEDFTVVGVLAFPPDLTKTCAMLGKKHPDQDRTLQFTRANWLAIRAAPGGFPEVRVWLAPIA
jgi:hypothetical protein